MSWKTGANAPLGLANGSPAIADVTAVVPVGTIATFVEDTQGPCELIYLPGVAATVAGDIVVMDLTPAAQTTTRLAKDTQNNTGRPVAIAIAATVAGQFGWYQIGGVALVNAIAATAAGAMYTTATTGSVGSAQDNGDQVLGARILTAVGTPSAGKSYAHLNRPCMQSQIV